MEPRPTETFEHMVRIGWGDCDPAKIAYTGRLPWFALEAINAWWEDKLGGDGWFQMELDRNVGTPFVRLEMDFAFPVTPRHRLICHVWPGKLCFSTRTVSVFIVADQFKKQSPPEDIRRAVEAHIPAGDAG